ncbi:DUF3019 domain-containing protein [Biformimicrobium ophioploci]
MILFAGASPVFSAELQILPKVCAVTQDTGSCNVTVKIKFSGPDAAEYCLKIEGRGLIRCFQNTGQFSETVNVNTKDSLVFHVEDTRQRKFVAKNTLVVRHFKPKRLVRRYGWDLL